MNSINNSDIHNNLPHADMRDVIGKGLLDFFTTPDPVLPSPYGSYGDGLDSFGKIVMERQNDLILAKHRLKLAKAQQGFGEIMSLMGWKDFDVSDETIYPRGTLAISFIGTEEEYKELLERINNED